MTTLSHFTVGPILAARREGADSAVVSLDLGLSAAEVGISDSGAALPDGTILSWDSVEEIARTESACFSVEDGRAERIQIYSEEFGRFYSLYPTPPHASRRADSAKMRRDAGRERDGGGERDGARFLQGGAPTMMAAGFPMHRIKGIDPMRDTELKVKAISPVFGEALDTCTGLGYTAIAMARTASKVMTIELDPAVHEICRRNPWSQELFTNPRIERVIGDAFEVVAGMPDESFARIVHDPPTMQLAGELYSGEMYRNLYRVLKRGGRMFHYVGDLNSAFGRSVAKGAARRLEEAGFRVTRRQEAFGLAAVK